MARTGSGKTLAYLIPLLLCPNRELALQILRSGKDLARCSKAGTKSNQDDTRLKWALVIGGEAMDRQFEALTSSPDV